MKFLQKSLILSLVMCLGCTIAFAAGGSIAIDELNMTINIPDGWMTFMQSVDTNDPNLQTIGMSAQDIMSFMKKGNIYLDAVSQELGCELIVVETVNPSNNILYNLRDLDDQELTQNAKTYMTSNKVTEKGISYTDCTIEANDHNKFLVYDFQRTDNDAIIYGRQYFTVANGKAISITLNSYTGEVTSEQKQIHKTIVDSIAFKEIPNPNPSTRNTASSVLSRILSKGLSGLITALVLGGISIIIGLVRARRQKSKETQI